MLAEAGVESVGENRAQDLQAKVDAYGDTFTWDFIGHLQSRKVKLVAPLVRMIHSVSTDSVLDQLAKHAPPELRVLSRSTSPASRPRAESRPTSSRRSSSAARCRSLG